MWSYQTFSTYFFVMFCVVHASLGRKPSHFCVYFQLLALSYEQLFLLRLETSPISVRRNYPDLELKLEIPLMEEEILLKFCLYKCLLTCRTPSQDFKYKWISRKGFQCFSQCRETLSLFSLVIRYALWCVIWDTSAFSQACCLLFLLSFYRYYEWYFPKNA